MNCLAYALRFWEEQADYRIWYNSGHCINLPTGSSAVGFLPVEDFGYCYFGSSFKELLNEDEKDLLKKYFNIKTIELEKYE